MPWSPPPPHTKFMVFHNSDRRKSAKTNNFQPCLTLSLSPTFSHEPYLSHSLSRHISHTLSRARHISLSLLEEREGKGREGWVGLPEKAAMSRGIPSSKIWARYVKSSVPPRNCERQLYCILRLVRMGGEDCFIDVVPPRFFINKLDLSELLFFCGSVEIS